jgi:hypothetical protein
MRCPTCGEVLADKEILLVNGMKEICDEMGVDDDIISQGLVDKNPKYIEKRKELVNKLFDNICCRIRAMTYIDLVQIIKG